MSYKCHASRKRVGNRYATTHSGQAANGRTTRRSFVDMASQEWRNDYGKEKEEKEGREKQPKKFEKSEGNGRPSTSQKLEEKSLLCSWISPCYYYYYYFVMLVMYFFIELM